MNKHIEPAVINLAKDDPYYFIGSKVESKDYWRWGEDNELPYAIARINRTSKVHRAILNAKAFYVAGQGFNVSENSGGLWDWINSVNNNNQSFRDIIRKLSFDKFSFGNAFVEFVTNKNRTFLNVFAKDATECRLQKEKKEVWMHQDWNCVKDLDIKKIPLYPSFSDTLGDGNLHSCIHIKDFENMFKNYGLASWIAGLDVAAIAYKTDDWNISRLDNSFNLSGILVIDGEVDSAEEAKQLKDKAEKTFKGSGNAGKVMAIVKNIAAGEGTKFVPLSQMTDGDWMNLHKQSTDDLIIAHNWYRSLSGIADNTGFDTNRILNEYQIALNTVILDQQQQILNALKEPIEKITGFNLESLQFINKPPITAKQPYMKIWEARKEDGLDYDENDPEQQKYLADLNKNGKSDNTTGGN